MKLSLNWLKKYVNLEKTPDEIAKALVQIGFEVEGIETLGLPPLEKVVVGEILSRDKHPNADRLGVCRVDVGDGEPLQIVCGATNYKVGDRVPVALHGALLPGNVRIKKGKLRGVESYGMMCSAKELGLGEDHHGLLILDTRPPLGKPLNEVFPDTDTVYDIEVTPNRPDCLSYIGMARETAAYFGLTLTYPEIRMQMILEKAPSLIDELRVEVPAACPHYRGYSIRGVKVGPSPAWLRDRLTAIGQHSINNVVDVTNYVLMELGQPLHAFDANKIHGKKIIVRHARKGEKLLMLDNKERELAESMLVIADEERPLVVAGVMGSIDAEVDENTADIFLEAAYFNPVSIRQTSRRLGVSSDSSYRYERGIDPCGAEFAAMRAIDLILEVAGGELAGSPRIAGEPIMANTEIEFDGGYMRAKLGFNVTDEEIQNVLSRLELDVDMTIHAETPATFKVSVPSFRVDLERPIDLVEECLRIYGTDKIPTAPVNSNALVGGDDPMAIYTRRVSGALSAHGFCECVNYPLRTGAETALWSGQDATAYALANPLSSDQSHLRPSIIPGLLDNALLNQSRGNSMLRLFECGRVFRENGGKLWEYLSVAAVVTNDQPQQWRAARNLDFYDMSATMIDLLRKAGIRVDPGKLAPFEVQNVWQSGQCATVSGNGFEARCGLLDIAMTQERGIKGDVYAVEVSFLPAFLEDADTGIFSFKHHQLPTQPTATRDIALLAPKDTPAATIAEALRTAAAKAVEGAGFGLESVRLFDLYEGKGLPEGFKSLAYSLIFRATDRTLTDAEVNTVFEKTQKYVADAGYPVRS